MTLKAYNEQKFSAVAPLLQALRPPGSGGPGPFRTHERAPEKISQPCRV